MTPFFIGRTHFCTTNFGNMVIFRQGNWYSLCSPGNWHYEKFFLIFSSKRVQIGEIPNNFWNKIIFRNSNKNTIFALSISTFFDEKIKNQYVSDNPGFLGYKVNISLLTEKLPYSKICGTKVCPSFKKCRFSKKTKCTVQSFTG